MGGGAGRQGDRKEGPRSGQKKYCRAGPSVSEQALQSW